MSDAIVSPLVVPLAPGARWQPVIGNEAQGLVDRDTKLSPDARRAILASSAEILSKCIPPTEPAGSATGLVVGYVQSGKTLSFATVLALSRDNGFQLVIVVAGTSTSLLDQSTRRIRRDLQVDDLSGPPRWSLYTNPQNNSTFRRNLQQTIDDWRDPDAGPSEKATVLITVMKNHRHLARLVGLLHGLDLEGVSALIVDDEADQASLNTLVAQGRQSTTYRRMLELRDALPNHTFLQYTATPQAPLLINIIDALSPDFVQVLNPGAAYVGGREFFGDGRLVEIVPPADIPSDNNILTEPPDSLLEALRLFLLGVAAGLLEGRSAANPNRSMLVHPSQKTDYHNEFKGWIGDVFDEWQRVMSLPPTDQDRIDLLGEFQVSHAELASTVADLPTFEALIQRLPRAFRQTRIEEVNARRGQTPIVEWTQSYGWILVGGQAMDRGFTVEGLTVTYMPRGPGVGNADTVQQRGRFFGYKRRYLGYCRIFLEQSAQTAFEEYVEHEELMRAQLQQWQASGRPLSEWKRAFVLSRALQPCRANVLQLDHVRGNYAARWFSPNVALAPQEVLEANREVVSDFLTSLTLVEEDPTREPAQRHRVARGVPLSQVVEELIVPYRVAGASDSSNLVGLLLQLSLALEGGQEMCTVYQMSPGFARRRAIDADGRVNELFQGPTRVAAGGYSYPGDSAFADANDVTVQIHSIDVHEAGVTRETAIPMLAVRLPARMDQDWISQLPA